MFLYQKENIYCFIKENKVSWFYIVIKLLIIMMSDSIVSSTVDINMPEMKYLADHLQPEECRRLVAALHFKSYNPPNALDAAEEKVSEDIPCLRLLLHWNSADGEGRGETHEMLFRRLRQIGRDDLAEWLGRTVFHELGQDLERSLQNPFQEFLNDDDNINLETESTTIASELNKNPNAWLPMDTIFCTVIILLCVLTTAIVTRSIYVFCKNKKPYKAHDRKYGKYDQLDVQAIVSESESEDRFDIRRKDDPALKLMGV